MWRYNLLLSSILMLSGCVNASAPTRTSVPSNWQQYLNNAWSYRIGVPPNFEIGKFAIQGQVRGVGFFSDSTDVRIHNIKDSCSASLIGTDQFEYIENAYWGKINISQTGPHRPYQNALCAIPTDGCNKDEIWSGDGCDYGQGAYALCAEKNGKTVVICISQQKDNPELAKQIFESFRWTEGEGAGGVE